MTIFISMVISVMERLDSGPLLYHVLSLYEMFVAVKTMSRSHG